MNKQIEEMARTLCGEMENNCQKCGSHDGCEFWIESSVLYNAGYRKQTEVAAEIFAAIEYLIWQNDTHPAYKLTEEIAELKKKYTEGEQQ